MLCTESKKLIWISPKVTERIASLRNAGATGLLLVEKAETIISRLTSGEGWQPGPGVAPRTQHGEKRIRKCIKYDLGWGFRMITVLRRDWLFVCYLGPHDECDRWLANNSRIKELEIGQGTIHRVAGQKTIKEAAQPEDRSNTQDDLDERLRELPDQSLRRIFCGLVEARRQPGMCCDQKLRTSREKAKH